MKTIIGNWKMNLGVRESVALTRACLLLLRGKKIAPQIIVCPSVIALSEVRKIVARSGVSLGAQNIATEDHGAFTGEISARMLTEVGVQYVLVGHSERRQLFHESSEEIRKKMEMAFEHHITPILCIGETQEEKSAGKTHAILTEQLVAAFKGMKLRGDQKVCIAYEPVWAIGSGETPNAQEIVAISVFIQEILQTIFPSSSPVSFFYGGSVQGENAYTFLREPQIDGLLVGGASLKIHQFQEIVEAATQVLIAQTSSL